MILDAILGKALATAPINDKYYEPNTGYVYGGATTAGVRVTESNALNYSVCWAATRLLSGTAGWLPFNLYKRMRGGGANIDFGHRVHRIIHSQPNQDMGAMMFRCRGVNHQVNWGNEFSEIRRVAGGDPFGLEPIHPWRIPPQNIRREDDGKIVYLVYRPNGTGQLQRVKQEDMFHVPSIISEDGVIGKGVISAAREAIGKAMATQNYGASSMKNPVPPIVIKNGKFKDKPDREEFRRQWEEVHNTPGGAGKPALLPVGAEVQALGFSLEDSQFIESQQFDVEEISRWYGVPPHLVGHLLRATFNNIEELGISFVKYSLIQWLKLWEQEVWRKLLTPSEQETHYAKFVVDALERGNMATRTEAGVKKFFNGLWTLNQWAEQEDMNPITETAVVDGQQVNLGDMHFVQQAMIPLSLAAKGPPDPAPKPAPPAEGNEDDTEVEESEQMQAQITAVTTSTATLALSVERIVAAVGALQSDNSRLSETVSQANQAVVTLAATVQEGQAASRAMHEELTAKIEEHATSSQAVQGQLSKALVRDVLARLMSVELHNIKNIAQQASRFDARLMTFYDKHRRTMELALLAPVSASLAAAGRTEEPLPTVQNHIDQHIAVSMQQLLGACDCQADELPARVEECVSKWHEERTMVTL